jgi:ABC-type proline/glycine betaine transport system substrate-binding protein
MKRHAIPILILAVLFVLPLACAKGPDLKAGKLTVPLAQVTKDDLKKALTEGGWKVPSVSTSGALMTITAMKGDVRATVSYHKPVSDMWKKRIKDAGGAIHVEGDVLLGVEIKGNLKGAQVLLNSLLGK